MSTAMLSVNTPFEDSSVPTPTRFLQECGEYTSLFTPSLGNFSEVNPFEYSFQNQKNIPSTPGTNSFKSPDTQQSLRYLAFTNNLTTSSQQQQQQQQRQSSCLPPTPPGDDSAVKIERVDEPKNGQERDKLQKRRQSQQQQQQPQSQSQPQPQERQEHEPEIHSPLLPAGSPLSPKPASLKITPGTTTANSIIVADQDTMQRATSEDGDVQEDSYKDDDDITAGSSSPKEDYGSEKRAGRRRDSYRSADDSDSSSGSYDKKRKHSDDNEDDSEVKRRRFLERNRMAASKCRQKKKAWMQELESRSDEITNRNKALHVLVANLKEEVLMLKDQLLAHRGCGCNVIQQYVRTSGHFNMSLMNAMVNNALASGPEIEMMIQPPSQPTQHIQQQQQMQQQHRHPSHHIPHSYPMQQQSHPYEQHTHVMQPHPHMMQQQVVVQPAMFSQ